MAEPTLPVRDDLFERSEAVHYMRGIVSEKTLMDWAYRKQIPCVKLGGRILFLRADLDAFIDSRRQPAGPRPAVDTRPLETLTRAGTPRVRRGRPRKDGSTVAPPMPRPMSQPRDAA